MVSGDESLDFTQANLDLAICLADDKGEHEGVRLGGTDYVTVGLAGGPDRPIGWPGRTVWPTCRPAAGLMLSA